MHIPIWMWGSVAFAALATLIFAIWLKRRGQSLPSGQQSPALNNTPPTPRPTLRSRARGHFFAIAIGAAVAIAIAVTIAVHAFPPEHKLIVVLAGILFFGICFALIFLLMARIAWQRTGQSANQEQDATTGAGATSTTSQSPPPKPRSGWRTFGLVVVWFWILSIVFGLVFPWAARKWWPGAYGKSVVTVYHPDRFSDEKGRRTELNRAAFQYRRFRETFPIDQWTLVRAPERWHGNWHAMPTGKVCSESKLLVYFMVPPNHNPVGPYDWCSNVDPHLPPVFWVQAVNPGEEIEFATDNPAIPEAPEGGPMFDLTVRPVIEPVEITMARAACSAEAIAAKFDGTATVSLVVREDGTIGDVKITESTGIPSEDQQMIAAARQTRFQPATLNGKPVPFEFAAFQVILDKPCK